jgi:hypothetical protein
LKNSTAILFISCIFFIGFTACKRDNGIAPDMGYAYFPAHKGYWIEYTVDSVFYNDFTNQIDSTRYYLKEKIESDFNDAAERPAFRIERYKKYLTASDWELTDVWFGVKTNTGIERIEENIRFVKLIFPVKNGNKWNGNNYNTLEEQEYKYENAHEPSKWGGLEFDSTVVVKQLENINLIEKQEFKEIYAKNTGLVYKEKIDVKTEINGTIKSGYRYYQTIKSFGND